MIEEEKIKFVNDVFEFESQLYMKGKQYNKVDEIWFNRYLTKSNFDAMIRVNFDLVYPIALKLVKNNPILLALYSEEDIIRREYYHIIQFKNS